MSLNSETAALQAITPTTESKSYSEAMNDIAVDILGLVRQCQDSSKFHLIIVEGPPGVGKTTIVEQVLLRTADLTVVQHRGRSTPLSLFKHLERNRQSLLLFDDCEGFLDHPDGIPILKAATWGDSQGARLVEWHSNAVQDVEPSFIFHGKIILIVNEAPTSSSAFGPLVSRALYYKVTLTESQRWEILRAYSTQHPDQGAAVACLNWLQENSDSIALNDINMRTFLSVYETRIANPSRWEHLASKLIIKQRPLDVARELLLSGLNTTQQVNLFMKRTGKSARTFYNLKKQIEENEYGKD